jgi:hypothetical protein
MRDRLHSRRAALLALSCVLAAGCADQQRLTDPDDSPTGLPPGVLAEVRCSADVRAGLVTCRPAAATGRTGLPNLIVGGQGVYIFLLSTNVGYNAGTETFSADVQVANAGVPQPLGTPDGVQVTGLKVFFHTGPTVTGGSGTVTVSNPDGTGTFTGSNQPYHHYPYVVGEGFITPAKNWQWSVPTTVTTFSFSVYVQADVQGENGFVAITPTTDFLEPTDMVDLNAGAFDPVGRPRVASITFTSSDPSVATVNPTTGLVTAVAGGRTVITASTGGPEAPGKAVITVNEAGYQIELLFLTSLTPTQQAAFEAARDRLEAIVTADLAAAPLSSLFQPACGGPAVEETVDDLVINVVVGPIDGPGLILGQAGPCAFRNPGLLPALGVMIFDSDDLADLESDNQLEDVILHEMGHVLGIGSLWAALGLLLDEGAVEPDCDTPALVDPYFQGALAIAAFDAAGGSGYAENKVPVENTGGPGTRCGHWRESIFESELMTGIIEAPGTVNPLSAITLQSLADMAYTVDLGEADAYTLPGTGGAAPARAAGLGRSLGDDIWRGPRYRIDPQGRMTQILPDRRPEPVKRLDVYRVP